MTRLGACKIAVNFKDNNAKYISLADTYDRTMFPYSQIEAYIGNSEVGYVWTYLFKIILLDRRLEQIIRMLSNTITLKKTCLLYWWSYPVMVSPTSRVCLSFLPKQSNNILDISPFKRTVQYSFKVKFCKIDR